MDYLRRLLGRPDADDAGGGPSDAAASAAARSTRANESGAGGSAVEDDEKAHELELARFEQDRTTDLVRRQQRYSDRSWTPPTQGGTTRAGDKEDAERDSEGDPA